MHSKGTHKQDEKTILRMGENICKRSNGQRINLQNIQTARAAQYQKNKQWNQKMSGIPKQTFLQRRHTDGQQAHEKMLKFLDSFSLQTKLSWGNLSSILWYYFHIQFRNINSKIQSYGKELNTICFTSIHLILFYFLKTNLPSIDNQ